MLVGTFEEEVWKVEGIRLFLRASNTQEVDPYKFSKACDGSWTVREWLQKRIEPCTKELELIVLDGDYKLAHRGKRVSNLRQSYLQPPKTS